MTDVSHGCFVHYWKALGCYGDVYGIRSFIIMQLDLMLVFKLNYWLSVF